MAEALLGCGHGGGVVRLGMGGGVVRLGIGVVIWDEHWQTILDHSSVMQKRGEFLSRSTSEYLVIFKLSQIILEHMKIKKILSKFTRPNITCIVSMFHKS